MIHIKAFWVFGLLSTVLVHANPFPSQAGDSTTTTSSSTQPMFSIVKRRRTHQCDNTWMKKIEAQAWADAGYIAEQASKWDNKGDNALQPLADYWMGNDSRKDRSILSKMYSVT